MTLAAQHDAIKQRRSAAVMKSEGGAECRTAHSDRQRAAMPLGGRLLRIRGDRTCVPSCIMPARRFPPPWTAEVTPNCFIVRDAKYVKRTSLRFAVKG
jgi:hypothetical protein